jgi:tRNA/rRNA methyltransferase
MSERTDNLPPVPLARCRVVLVGPRIAANLGATARVMRNLGLRELVLVAPEVDPNDPRGRLLATHSADILDNVLVVDDLAAAVADCVLVVGTSARTGGLFRRQSLGPPEDLMPRLVAALARGPCALVFGPESCGLRNDDVVRCHALLHLDTDPEYPALNLAQAVAICLYELRRAWRLQSLPKASPDPVASFGEQEQLFRHLRTALEEIHFLYGDKADALMHALRYLLGRAQLTPMEVGVLHGLARQIRWFVAQHKPPEDRVNP